MIARTAAKYLRKSPQFVDKWVQRYKEIKCVDELPDTTKGEDRAIMLLYSKNLNLSLRKGLLAKRKIDVSILTLKRRLKENNVAWRSTVSKLLLSVKHVENCLAWTHENIDRDWSDIVFTDESFFGALIPIKRIRCLWKTHHRKNN
ncbi:hypothetical protein WN51_03096 [Melipona quadrifasciata]|uniref:Uncharacterized protein n=1 Tax=Melipona quadrifasciata TaxID=166423 RepID=A0A0M8ZZ08_9HYME|nr:hypothetical protein WN51_03096 [Melipona quadrifasciata]